jgi:hypothetical protein
MAIQYYLMPNNLTDTHNDYRAVTVSIGTITEQDLIERIAKKNTGVPTQIIMAVLLSLRQVKEEVLREGFTITTDDVNYKVDISGNFKSKDDVFDPSRHQLKANPRNGREFNSFLRDITPVKIVETIDHSRPYPTDYLDINSETANSNLTPGGIGRIKGLRLNFDPADPLQGVFFINATDNAAVKVPNIARNKPSELIFSIPATLAKGDYFVEIRNKLNGIKEIKSERLADILSVL